MSNLYGSIDLTLLGNIVRQHPDKIKKITFKDGTVHQFLNIDINERQQTDQYGRTHYIRAGIKKAEQKEGVNYYVADLKPSQNNTTATTQPQSDGEAELPF